MKNLKDVLGNNFLIWAIPVKSENVLEGYSFDVKEEFKSIRFEKEEIKENSTSKKDFKDETRIEIKNESE